MGRLKGSKNKNSSNRIIASSLSSEERIRVLANLVIDRIIQDQKDGSPLFHKISQR